MFTALPIVFVLAAAPEPRFEPQTIDDKVAIGYGLAIGDVDGDGKPDILLADKTQIVWYQNPRNPRKSGEAWQKHVMAENLTERDNVCIAARDIDGDGKVEVAVGAQWNPGETNDEAKSGAIFYLIRPADPTQKWEPVRIEPHDVTTHRMHWIKTGDKKFQLAVLPLHGKGNKNGQGAGVRIQFITPPADPRGEWKSEFLDTGLHMTHNFDVLGAQVASETLLVGGKEQVLGVLGQGGAWSMLKGPGYEGAGEVRLNADQSLLVTATIEPMHGNRVVAYPRTTDSTPPRRRVVLDEQLSDGHALAVGDLLGLGSPQIIAGWRKPDTNKKVGIKMYVAEDEKGEKWTTYVIDDNTMACEDLKLADLNGDGKLDVIAAGRDSHNLVVYWNRR